MSQLIRNFAAVMALKTREKLIEVARQLFARKGVENTTMLDIANASDRGRRTLYTYFKNKREIHQAVIERESDQMVSRQRAILAEEISWSEKLEKFIEIRLQAISAEQDGSSETERRPLLLMRFDYRRSERTRRVAEQKEIEILRTILANGRDAGEFSPAQASRALALVMVLLQCIDSPHLELNFQEIGTDRTTARREIIEFIINGIQRRESTASPSADNAML